MDTILLFYSYFHLEYPERVQKWQLELCKELGLKGRIIIAHEGINGTLGGATEKIERYKKAVENHPLFKGIDFKESSGVGNDFPRLRVVIKNEVVNLGLDPKTITADKGGKHLTPQEVHELLSNKPENLVVLDARNKVEWAIGKFTNAITPNIETFRELPEFINQNEEQFKDKQVLMYCTGGIRCERASAFLKSKNITQEVYQIEGGIQRYTEQYPDGFFRGKNYVFDGRVAVKVNDDILSNCLHCKQPCDEYVNCLNGVCNEHFVCCKQCVANHNQTCRIECNELVTTGAVQTRPVRYRNACIIDEKSKS